jgi:DNA-binding MarR family transcriptional regulator
MEKSREDFIQELANQLSMGLDKLQKVTLKHIINSSNSNLQNMSLSQINVLAFLESRKNARMKDIGDELGIKASSVTHLVDKLIKEELVERFHIPDDRRVIEVNLSEKGKALLGELKKGSNKYWKKILEKFDETECEELLRLTKKMDDSLSELL